MGNFLFNFKRLQIENSDADQFQLATTTIGGSFAEDSGRGSAGTYRRLSADCESCRRNISPSEGYASGSQASVETVNEVENNQSVHYGISRENQSKIKQMFIDMKDSIDIDGILDRFIQDGDLTEDAQERIMFNNPRRKQVELFLFRLFRLKRNAFDRFVQYMREDECLVHIADQLQKGIKLPALETARLKPHEIRLQIEHHMEDILREIEPDEVAEYFMVYEVCEVNEYEEVVSEKKTTRAKGLALLHLLILNHIPSGYQVFLTALRELNRTGLLQKLKKRHIRQDVESTRSVVTAKFTFGNQSDLPSLDQIVGGPSGYSLRCTRATQCDEEDLVANFRSETVKAEINRRLIPETNTMLYDTISGSLIFHLKWTSQAWRQLSVDRLREVVGTVVRILMEKGNKEDTESQTWNVEVCAIPSTLNVRSSTTDPKDAVEVITVHKEFLATELNGLRIAEQMNGSGVLSSDDLSDVRGKSDRR
ncbi:uncharacterized protein LOC128203276 isoform X2 [Mya arenaria]|uniref:uncharacterized protein LOC128203276 isoform X2 n=1 Tax=Mya arenaria TaxID=6604 RepID=UPI0022E02866|nr:uncharacterized protein LOC128203276 isoform X2 [Mya arenaria]